MSPARRKLTVRQREAARRARNKRLTSSKNEHFCTPAWLLDLVRELGPIGLDPCSNALSTTNASTSWWGLVAHAPKEHRFDGLAESWRGRGLVYVNPPYGAKISPWIAKILAEARAGVEIVSLVPARVDTHWFHSACYPPETDGTCLWKGRVTFEPAKQPAMFPSAICYYGPQGALFARIFREYGRMLRT
jgi:hypothetical protein